MDLILYMLVGAAIAGGVAWFLTRGKRKDAERAERLKAAHVTNDLTGVRAGGVLKLPPFGPNTGPIETAVNTRHRYNNDGRVPWFELECLHGARTLLIEWERDGSSLDVTCGYTDGNPRLHELGLDEDRLIELDEGGRGAIEWDGKTWRFVGSGENDYFEDDGHSREQFYAWEFEAEDESAWLTIEKWAGDHEFECFVSWPINAERIEIYSGGDD